MSKKTSTIIFSALGLVIVILAVTLAFVVTGNSSTIMGLGAVNDDLESRMDILASQKESLEFQVNELKAKIAELESEASNTEVIDALKLEIENKTAEIAELEADIAKYQTVFTIDVRAQAQLIEQLEEYISTACPYVRVAKPGESDSADTADTTPGAKENEPEYIWVKLEDLVNEALDAHNALGEVAEPLFTPEELAVSGMTESELTKAKLREAVLAREDVVYPSVSVYYEDLATGYHYGYNEDVPYVSASVIKAPYILSILREIANDEEAYLDAKAEAGESLQRIDTDEDGVEDTIVYEYSDPLYNLSDVVVYDSKTMAQSGSGEIRKLPDGTELSYVDFIKYTLEYSDNIGFDQLKKRFGYNRYYTLLRDVKANTILKNAKMMTAADTGKLFKAIYEFTEENETYGKLMYDSMRKANHTVIIPMGVYPTPTLHKYGWDEDSYHDGAIVLHTDKPYVLTVFTDLDMGGNEINAYLQQIVKMINKLHKGFYQS